MCLIVQSGPHTAVKNLYTLKMGLVLNQKKFETPYQKYEMRYGKTYKSPIKKDEEVCKEKGFPNDAITYGLHSLRPSLLRDKYKWIRRKFDFSPYPKSIILCCIPKNSTYYMGEDADVVSDTLKPLYPLLYNSTVGVQRGLEEVWWEAVGDYEKVVTFMDTNFSWLEEIEKVCASYNIELL